MKLTLLLKTLLFKPKKDTAVFPEPIEFDRQKAIKDLSELIRFQTVSYTEKAKENEIEFNKLEEYIQTAFPNVFKTTEFTKIGSRALLFKWRGKTSINPSVLMAHYDVVPAEGDGWIHPPFAGDITDGELWGRGTLDTKCTFNAILQAAEKHILDGFIPSSDIYLAFAGDEEINGEHADKIVDILKDLGAEPKLVLDEGGAVVKKVFPGVDKSCALIGIAEKGMVNIQYLVKSTGGHSSTPPKETPISILAKACRNVTEHPFPSKITKPALEMFDNLGRHSKSFPIKLIFANMWLFKGLLGKLALILGGEMNSLVRTSTAFTQMKGSSAFNVIPPVATMVSNHRIIQGETPESVKNYLEKVISDDRVELSIISSQNPSRVSVTNNSLGYDILKETIKEVWDNTIVSPYLMVAATDSSHYGRISDKVYRFSPLNLTKEQRSLIHSYNERIPLASIEKSVEFYIRIIEKL